MEKQIFKKYMKEEVDLNRRYLFLPKQRAVYLDKSSLDRTLFEWDLIWVDQMDDLYNRSWSLRVFLNQFIEDPSLLNRLDISADQLQQYIGNLLEKNIWRRSFFNLIKIAWIMSNVSNLVSTIPKRILISPTPLVPYFSHESLRYFHWINRFMINDDYDLIDPMVWLELCMKQNPNNALFNFTRATYLKYINPWIKFIDPVLVWGKTLTNVSEIIVETWKLIRTWTSNEIAWFDIDSSDLDDEKSLNERTDIYELKKYIGYSTKLFNKIKSWKYDDNDIVNFYHRFFRKSKYGGTIWNVNCYLVWTSKEEVIDILIKHKDVVKRHFEDEINNWIWVMIEYFENFVANRDIKEIKVNLCQVAPDFL